MFRELRTKFVLTNLLTTTLVLVVAFTSIYLVAAASNESRPPRHFDQNASADLGSTDPQSNAQNTDLDQLLAEHIDEDRTESLNSLLISLLVTGACVEVIVLLLSLYLADQSIKPVKTAYLAQKEFIANASHEIKTPLAVIQANLEAADIQDNHWIDNVAVKVADLAALNQQLLTLARLEAKTSEKDVKELDLKSYLQGLLAPLEPQLKAKNLKTRLVTKDLKKPKVTLNEPAFKQLLNILLDNAIKYGKTKITVVATDHAVTVKNDGATISKENLAHIFDRFYQTDKTKSGVGLGLAIAKQLARDNHWQLTAASDDASTSFTLTYKK